MEGHAFALPDSRNGIVAEVLNGTDVNGLARTGARVLRQQGIDVVFLASGPATDSTTVIVRRGERQAGEAVQRALGVGRIREQRDTTRHVDVTVMLGPDFKEPEGMHP